MSNTDPALNTEELYRLYQELDQKNLIIDDAAAAKEEKADQAYAASQWQLMWRKFIRNRAAIFGGIGILIFYLVALFGDFIAPYTLTTRFRTNILMPPQRIYLIDQGAWHPYVNGVTLTIDKNLRKHYAPDPTQKFYLGFFVKGEPYKLFGLIRIQVISRMDVLHDSLIFHAASQQRRDCKYNGAF